MTRAVDDRSDGELDPAIAERVRQTFDEMPALDLVGAELASIGVGRCEVAVPYRRDLTQQQGFLHAGVVSMIADTAGGLAARTMMPPEKTVLAVEFKINLMSPAIGDRFHAVARVLKPGRTLTICEIDVYAETGGDQGRDGEGRRHCARMQQTCIAIDRR
ncbi:PaaI family thioesterase [Fodinicurvata sp. EGI_FJ10296]|uniref:PaaI family thioesterase n=1 Tax=Fodinicurvata sp. EGI_FJ10296 TaxID=3231908 RepID=UPI003456AA2A